MGGKQEHCFATNVDWAKHVISDYGLIEVCITMEDKITQIGSSIILSDLYCELELSTGNKNNYYKEID